MFTDIMLPVLLGIGFGTLTGIIPGIHPNTVFAGLVSLVLTGMLPLPTIPLLFFVVSVAVSNTFVDFIPSVLFGAPDPSSALSVLPGHRLLMSGQGYVAVCLTVVGGLGVASLVLLTLPLLVYILPVLYWLTRPVVHVLLAGVVVFMVARERKGARAVSLWVLLVSGAMGTIALNAYPSGSMLFPSLTGLFGISGLVHSMGSGAAVPRQCIAKEFSCDVRKGILAGWASGWFAGMLPGVGAAQAGVISGQALRARTGEFLVSLGGINTSNILFTLAMFYLLGKTRSGAVWAMSQFAVQPGPWLFTGLVLAGLLCCFASGLVTLGLARAALGIINRVPYTGISLAVIAALFSLSFLLSGFPGLLAAGTGSLIGLACIRSGAGRSHMMGFLIIPTILHFSGLYPAVSLTLCL